jgi:hypothetical protein
MPDQAEEHVWVIASTVDVTLRQARRAVLRGSIRLKQEVRIDALEVYCRACRRPWDDVLDEPCIAPVNNEHLRGGPIKERRKRKQYPHHYHDCVASGCEHDCVALGCGSPGGTQQIPAAG